MDQERDLSSAGARFPDDDGGLPPGLAAALAAYAEDAETYPELLASLQRSRLLVPIVAVATEVARTESGLAVDKRAELAAVLIHGADSRTALLAFSHYAALLAWARQARQSDVRPVPVLTHEAAQSALGEGAAALVIDIAGPTPVTVQGLDLTGLANQWQLTRVAEGSAWIRPD